MLVAAAIGTAAAQIPASRSTPLFDVTSDDVWLNLHHYRYVIGRAHAGIRGQGRRGCRTRDQALGQLLEAANR